MLPKQNVSAGLFARDTNPSIYAAAVDFRQLIVTYLCRAAALCCISGKKLSEMGIPNPLGDI